jgi:hypothetical protein
MGVSAVRSSIVRVRLSWKLVKLAVMSFREYRSSVLRLGPLVSFQFSDVNIMS